MESKLKFKSIFINIPEILNYIFHIWILIIEQFLLFLSSVFFFFFFFYKKVKYCYTRFSLDVIIDTQEMVYRLYKEEVLQILFFSYPLAIVYMDMGVAARR